MVFDSIIYLLENIMKIIKKIKKCYVLISRFSWVLLLLLNFVRIILYFSLQNAQKVKFT